MRLAPALLVLAACGASVHSTQFRGPDGSPDWWDIECHRDNGLCLREAGEVCPHGYDVAGKESHDDTVTNMAGGASTLGTTTFANSTARTTTVTNGELTIHCRGPSGRTATTKSGMECAPEMRPSAVQFWPPEGCPDAGWYSNIR
jgi:hypothetical protein